MSLAKPEINEMATHVLAVDDSAADRDLVRLSLLGSTHCYKLECAERLSEGLEKLGNQRADVVLLDLNLPDSQGKDTVKRIVQHAAHVPVVVLTGADDRCLALESVRLGAQDYIVKGQIDSVALPRAIQDAIERHNFLKCSRRPWPRYPKSNEKVVNQDPKELSSSLPCISTCADGTLRSSTRALTAGEGRLEFRECIMKSREHFHDYIIEVRVYQHRDGTFSSEISIEDHNQISFREMQLYLPNSFKTPDSAKEIAVQAGRQRINEDALE
jgi:DNA-binding NarL/FixJ family response regulator